MHLFLFLLGIFTYITYIAVAGTVASKGSSKAVQVLELSIICLDKRLQSCA